MNKQNGNMGNNEVCESMTGPTGPFVAANIAMVTVTSMIGPTGNTVNTPISHPESTGEIQPAQTAHLCISPSFEAKKLVLEHILYEFQMYLWTTNQLLTSSFSKDNYEYKMNYDAIYIAQKISLRNILYFFYNKNSNQRNKDIHFKKFFKNTLNRPIHLFNNTDFNSCFNNVCGIPYWSNNDCITKMLHKIIAHLTDARFDWIDIEENYEYILGKQEIQTEICTNVKSAIKKFLSKIQINDGKDIIYKYKATDGSEKFKDIAKELEDKRIQDIITAINQLMTFTD